MRAHPHGRGLATGLRDAVEAAISRPGVVRTLFQPIVDLGSATVTGYEALTRIDADPRMSPDLWFEAAYELGLGPDLEAVALASALRGRAVLPPNCFLTVNLGPEAVMTEEIQAVLAAAGDLRGLVIELTEQAPVDDYPALLETLAPLRAAGAMLAVDDAGAGFASLRHITSLRPEFVKIDRGHVTGIDRDGTKVAVVQTLGDFASRLDAWIIAEGVETAAELERLVELKVPLAQGYHLGRPSPGMAGVPPEVAVAHGARSTRRRTGVLGPLLEPVAVARADALPEVAGAFLADPAIDVVALCDEHGRPSQLVHRAPWRELSPVLVTGLDDDLADLVRRLLLRPAVERFDPLVACDQQGRAVALLRVERLVAALVDGVQAI